MDKFKGRRKVYVNYETDKYKLDMVVYRYRNNISPKISEIDLKTAE